MNSVSVASVSLQALISLALVRSEFRKRLRGAAQSPSAASPVPAES